MRVELGVVAVAVVLLVTPEVTTAQRSVVAVGREAFENRSLVVNFGRELRADTRRVGLRVYVDYSRLNVGRMSGKFFSSDTGPLISRPLMVKSRSRTAALWLSASYTPIRWVVEPHIVAAVGVQDIYGHTEIPPLDSATIEGVSWPSTPHLSYTDSRFGPAFNTGLGLSARIGRVRLFGETRLNLQSSLGQRATYASAHWRRTLTFGARF